MGYCISGDVVVGQNQIAKTAIFFTSEPQITYHSNSGDQGYWGYAYTTFNGGASFVDGSYTIFQCANQAACQIIQSYDCINGVCTIASNGLYSSLSVCQTACGKQGCSGQCVSSSDWAQIQGLISQLKNRSCG